MQEANTALSDNLDKTHVLVASTVERLAYMTKNINQVNTEMELRLIVLPWVQRS